MASGFKLKWNMNSNVEQIKERLNIVDAISGYVRLIKAGTSYKGLCPFHNEKTPSFMVNPSRQSWHCFGCSEGGDIFTFIEKIENIEFLDALKMLAEKAGVHLEYSDPKVHSEKDRIYEICEHAAQFFTASLSEAGGRINTNDTNGNPILNYLYKRGLKDETIKEWRLGYAPDSWNSLLNFLKTKNYNEIQIEKSGLIIRSGSTSIETDQHGNYPHGSANNQRQSASIRYHDRFRNRLMFPIFDTSGRIVAFSGRIMSDIIVSQTERADSGKYINSPETILFSKSRVLYGLDKAKSEIRKKDKAILVEGQLDVLLPWQDGARNIVATSGTALTEEQLNIIKRLTGNLVMAFDMDDAGFRATKRGIDMAQGLGFNISVLRLESGKDAADFVKDNPGKFEEMAEKADPIMSYYFQEIFKKFSTDKVEGKKIIALNILSEIKKMPSAIDRSNWIRELSLRLEVSEADLKEEMEQLESQINADNTRINAENFPRESAPNPRLSTSKTRKEILSERLLALLLKKTELIAEVAKVAAYLPVRDFEFLSAFSANQRIQADSELKPRLDFLHMLGDFELSKANSDFDIGKEIMAITKEIEREHYKESLLKIGFEIKKYEVDNLSTDNLIKEFQNTSKKLYQLNGDEKGKKI